MPPKDPTIEQMKTRLTRLLPSAAAFAETVYRSSTPKYANESDLLTGEGSRLLVTLIHLLRVRLMPLVVDLQGAHPAFSVSGERQFQVHDLEEESPLRPGEQ